MRTLHARSAATNISSDMFYLSCCKEIPVILATAVSPQRVRHFRLLAIAVSICATLDHE